VNAQGAPAPVPEDSAPVSSLSGISVQATAIVGAGLLVSQVIAMGQMLVVSRLLGPEQFGAFGALAVILLLGSTTMAATQVVLARHVASGGSQQHIGAPLILSVGACTAAITLAVSPFIAQALNLDDPFALVMVALTFIPFTITGAQLGLLQGSEQHKRLSLLYAVSTCARVAGAIAAAAVARTADAAVLGLALGAFAGAAAGQLLVVGQPTWGGREGTSRGFLGEVFHAAHALVALYALTNLDVLIARARLTPYEAGLYASGALVARAVFFLPTAVLVAAFPRMVAGARNAQRQAVMAVAGLGLVAVLVVAAVPTLVVQVIAGPQFLGVASQVWIFALAGAGFGVVQVLLYARMAHHDRRAALLLWGGVLLLLVLGLTLGTSIHALALCAAGTAWVVSLGGMAWAGRSRTRAPGAEPSDQPMPTAWE
jgi:O-antigen/teichoic acid export membrane protein